MARATLEMFLKLTGANKTSQELQKVSKSTKDLDNDVKNSAKSNEQFAAGMSGLGSAAIAGAAAIAGKSLLDFSLSAIQAASSAQEAAGAFGTTFGGAAEKLNEQLAENANLFGLTTAEAQQLISVFGSVAQGIGFTQQESADLSSELFNLAGDIASFNNITAGAAPVLQAFRSALVGEREALKTYGIAITEAEVQTKAFELTGKNSADALTRQEKALATSALMQILGVVSVFENLRDVLSFGDKETQENLRTQVAFGNQLQRVGAVFKALGLVRKTDIAVEKAQEIQTQKLNEQFSNYNHNINEITKSFVKNRQGVSINRVAYAKFGEEIDKKLNPIFGEQNALLLTNIQLETDRHKLLNLVRSANDDVTAATLNRNQAAKELQELQIQENVNDAQAAIKKAELQTQIAFLTEAQNSGKDVTLDLQLATAELAEAEFELANDSDRLKLAQDALVIAENNLQTAIKNQELAIKSRNDELLKSIDLTDKASDSSSNLNKILQSISGTDFGNLVSQGFVQLGGGNVIPAPVSSPDTTSSTGGGGGSANINLTTNVVIDEETIASTVQKVNTKIQQQGKTFLVR